MQAARLDARPSMRTRPLPHHFVPRLLVSLGLALGSLIAGHPVPAYAQMVQAISAEGKLLGPGGSVLPFSLTFRPAGGVVTGAIDYPFTTSSDKSECTGSLEAVLQGRYAGSDRGSVSGSAHGLLESTCADGTLTRRCYDAVWGGTFHAAGFASGTWSWNLRTSESGPPLESGRDTWQLTFSSAAFQSAHTADLTPEYIRGAFGVSVVDSPPSEGLPAAKWTSRELFLLSDLLKDLPPGLLTEVAGITLIRSHVDHNATGAVDDSQFARYLDCDLAVSPTCSQPSASIRLFDRAHCPFDFPNDPAGDIQFKATILHELIHAAQATRDRESRQSRLTPSLLDDWIAAIRPTSGEAQSAPGSSGSGWVLAGDTWLFLGDSQNGLPTKYAATSPAEDLAESAMLYMFNPGRLVTASIQRYDFIRDRIFAGLEYPPGPAFSSPGLIVTSCGGSATRK